MIDPIIKQDLELYLKRNYRKEKFSTAAPPPVAGMSLMNQKLQSLSQQRRPSPKKH